MREGVISTEVFGVRGVTRTTVREEASSREESVRRPAYWNPEKFADEQIRNLVRQVFFSSVTPARQVVFSAAERETDVRGICRRVGETLAAETNGDVAVVADYSRMPPDKEVYRSQSTECLEKSRITPLRDGGTRVRGNLWLLPPRENGSDVASTASSQQYLGQIRREFEYSIVAGPGGGESHEVIAISQLADGMILVLSAERTRRIAARKIRDALEVAHVRLLGTVLSDREFPIPERIYRRL